MDAPERIWARKHPVRHGGHWHDSTNSSDVAETVNGASGTINPFVEYTRADLPPTLSAALTVPEVKALVQLLKEARYDLEVYVDADWPSDLRSRYKSYQSKWDRDMELPRRIDAALRAIEGATDE